MNYNYTSHFDPINLNDEKVIKNLLKGNNHVDIVITNYNDVKYVENVEIRNKLVISALKTKLGNKFKNVTIVISNIKNKKTDVNYYNNTDIKNPVTELLLNDPFISHKDVKNYLSKTVLYYIKDNELYKQNSYIYDELEEDFLKKYEKQKIKNKWPEPSITADILAYNSNKILLIRRGNFPYKNCWALPGGFFELKDEELSYTASRELNEETTLKIAPDKFDQIKTYSHKFDPRMRIIDVAFSTRVNARDMKKAIDDASKWFDIDNLPRLAFHHKQIIEDWIEKNKNIDFYPYYYK